MISKIGEENVTHQQLLDNAWRVLDPFEAVPKDDPHHWYEDLAEVRGIGNFTSKLTRSISRQADRPQRVLIMGHRGCGKSTEIGRLSQKLEGSGFRCAHVQVDRKLDKEDLDIVDIQVLLVETVGGLMEGLGYELPQELQQRIGQWFFDEEKLVELTRDAQAELQAGSSAPSAMAVLFKKLLPKFRVSLALSRKERQITREKVDKALPQFVGMVADLVKEAKGVLQDNDFQGLVILIDGVEKAVQSVEGRARVSKILIEQSEQWGQLDVPLVFTGPLELFTEETRLQNHFDDHFLMPAIAVEARPTPLGSDDRPNLENIQQQSAAYAQKGRSALRSIVERRVMIDRVFEDPEDLDHLIRASAGSIRDLFRLLRDAIDHAGDKPLRYPDVQDAIKQQRLHMLPVLLRDDLALLRRVMDDPADFDHGKNNLSLLHRELVIPYSNGGVWFAVHPAVRDRVR